MLLDALFARGLEPSMMAWDDPAADWSGVRLCVLRSTWNYYRSIDAFLAWLDRVGDSTELWNPRELVKWNAHKGYLRDLAGKGVPIVPTEWIARGSDRSLDDAMRVLGVDTVVVKPAVSAASFSTSKIDRASLERGEREVRAIAQRCDVMVQPYVASVEGYGERSIVWIDGVFTHAIRKSPRFGGEHEQVSAAQPIAEDERALAERTLATLEGPFMYARVDLARDARGAPMLMELELIEPSLFLLQSELACARLADGIARRAR